MRGVRETAGQEHYAAEAPEGSHGSLAYGVSWQPASEAGAAPLHLCTALQREDTEVPAELSKAAANA